jgi:hypothetical protein
MVRFSLYNNVLVTFNLRTFYVESLQKDSTLESTENTSSNVNIPLGILTLLNVLDRYNTLVLSISNSY